MLHHARVVAADLGRGRAFQKPGVRPPAVDAIFAERKRVHTVVSRRLVQPNERLRVMPVPAGRVPPIDHHHAGVGVRDQRVHERHPDRAGAHDEIVRFQPNGHAAETTTEARTAGRTATGDLKLAEGVGFEPTVRFPVHTLSKRAP
jgi:hypothetical protein